MSDLEKSKPEAEPFKSKARPGRKDVALAAGVSTATVSLVLNNRDEELRIAPQTREKVLRAARELGYNPNPLMQSILRRKTNTISLWLPREAWNSENPYWMGVVQDVREGCSNFGYDLLLHHDRKEEDVEVALSRIMGGLVDGVIINPMVEDTMATGLAKSHVPTVAIDNEFEGLRSVMSDGRAGIRMIVEHLCNLGHQTFAYINRSGRTLYAEIERREEIKAALAARGFHLHEANIFGCHQVDQDCLDWYLALEPKPTAVICFNDMRAHRFVELLTSKGVRVPAEVSVTGFDGKLFPESNFRLTTYEVSHEKICENAVLALLELMAQRQPDEGLFLVPGRFIDGSTTGPLGA